MEVRRFLPVELAAHRAAVLGGAEPLEAIVDELGVLLVEVLVGHHVRGAGVHLAAAHLHTQRATVKKKDVSSRNESFTLQDGLDLKKQHF